MIKILLFVFLTSVTPYAVSMQDVKESGKKLGQKQASAAFKNGKKLNEKELLAPDLKNKTFDAKKAASNVKNRNAPESDSLEFITSRQVQENQRKKSFHEDELFIKTSEKIFSRQDEDNSHESVLELKDEVGYTLHTCMQGGDPFLINTERTLNVQVDHISHEKAKVCLGHNKNAFVKKIGNFSESTKALKKQYKSNPAIDPKSVKIICVYSRLALHYYARISYKHVDNAIGCDNCKKRKVQEDTYKEIGDEWIYDDRDLWNLATSPDSTILSHECVDSSPKKIVNGKKVKRRCWKEKISFLYQIPSTNDCNFLKKRNCEQIKQECTQTSFSGCAQWKLSFRCLEGIARKATSIDFELDLSDKRIEYSPNQSFSEVAAKLTVFDEIKKEMEKSKAIDVTKLEIFNGKRMSCSKNVVDSLMYDCCFSYSGLAKQMGLSKCDADEIGLAEMREQGFCHYIGSFEEKFLDLWKSRDEHVFCCFPSKLSRIVQEEGRKQLGLDWGKPKEPNCRGFTTTELSSLNFSKMDLSEICTDFVKKLPEDMPDRLKAFQSRLQQDIEQAEIKK